MPIRPYYQENTRVSTRTSFLVLVYIVQSGWLTMQEQKEPMSGKKLFGIVAAVMVGAVVAGLVLFTNFL